MRKGYHSCAEYNIDMTLVGRTRLWKEDRRIRECPPSTSEKSMRRQGAFLILMHTIEYDTGTYIDLLDVQEHVGDELAF